MVDVDIRFIKGVLVVTLEGVLNNNSISSIKDNLLSIIKKGGIKELMFVINDCIIDESIDLFDKCNQHIINNKGKMYIYGLNKNIKKMINGDYYTVDNISNEFKIVEGFNLC